MNATRTEAQAFPFEFTDEEAERIKAKDPDVMRAFYERNYKMICKLVKKYVSKRKDTEKTYLMNYWDYLGDVYLSLPYLDYRSREGFFRSLRFSFRAVEDGGLWYCQKHQRRNIGGVPEEYKGFCIPLISTNEDGEEIYVTDFLGASSPSLYEDDPGDEYERKAKRIFEFCSPFLKSPMQVEFLQLWLDGYTDKNICEKMGKCNSTEQNLKRRVRSVLLEHFEEIKDFLHLESGLSLSRCEGLYRECLEAEKEREAKRQQKSKESAKRHKDKWNAYRKEYRARKRALQLS